jgi:hypothetical protein
VDADRALGCYTKFIKQNEAVDATIQARATNAFRNISDAVGDAALLYTAEFTAAITEVSQAQRFVQTNTLLKAIESESNATGCQPGVYAGYLALWNQWFHQRQLKLNNPPIVVNEAYAMVLELYNASWDDDAGFKAYCAAVSNPHRGIYDMRKKFAAAGLPMTSVYTTMHFLKQHNLPVDKLNDGTAKDLHYLSTLAPPLTVFGGFAAWGPGNHGSIDENKKGHFLKHVLDAHPLPEQALPWQGECAIWWRKLDIRLTRQLAEDKLPGGLFQSVKQHFPAEATGTLPFEKVEAVIGAVKSGGGWPAELQTRFLNDYQIKYVNAALEMSRSMTDIIVHTDETGSKINLKGLKGEFFIGGRMEGSALGLSTCFVPKPGIDLASLNVNRQVWKVSPN